MYIKTLSVYLVWTQVLHIFLNMAYCLNIKFKNNVFLKLNCLQLLTISLTCLHQLYYVFINTLNTILVKIVSIKNIT